MKYILALFLLLFSASTARAQPALPCSANVGVWTVTTTSAVLWVCNSNSTAWINASVSSIPSGLITFVTSGTCPAGFTEVTALSGKTLFGTLAANGDVGGLGGSVTITPAGTNQSLTFTGSALATHAHELPFQKVAGGTGLLGMLAPSIFGTGTSRARESQSAAPTANTTSAAVLLSQAISAGTPAGTINTPAFTGTQFDNRSAYIKVIFCRKD